MTKNDIIKKIRSRKVIALQNKYKVKKMALFGSYAKGSAGKKSDIDFLVTFKNSADLLDQAELKIELEKVFKNKVDVVTLQSLKKDLKKIVLKEAVAL